METEEEEIDTLHRQIYQLVVNDIPKAVGAYLDAVRERRKLLNEISKFIEPINVKKFTFKELSDWRITGADGGANGKELEGFYFGVIGAIAYTSKGLEEEDKTPISFGTSLIWDDEFDPGRRAAAIRDKFMYDVARIAIVERKPDFLLLDGPLIPNAGYIPHSDDSEAYREDYENMMDALFSLLDLVRKEHEKRGMLMACVVKRVRSTRYSTLLNLPKPLRDSAILNPILKIGQRTPLIDAAEGRMLKEVFPSGHKKVKQFFLKSSRMSPIRVEIPEWLSSRVDEIASLIYSTSDPLTGIPFHILRADALTRVNIPTTDLTYTRFISHVMDKVKSGELAEQDLDLANLRRLEVWRL
jgi:hypothetical protein